MSCFEDASCSCCSYAPNYDIARVYTVRVTVPKGTYALHHLMLTKDFLNVFGL